MSTFEKSHPLEEAMREATIALNQVAERHDLDAWQLSATRSFGGRTVHSSAGEGNLLARIAVMQLHSDCLQNQMLDACTPDREDD